MDHGGLQSGDRRHPDAWRQRRILVRQRAAGAPSRAPRARAERGRCRCMYRVLLLPIPSGAFQKIALVVYAATVVFNVAPDAYYRGSEITPFHGGPVRPSKPHLALTGGALLPHGAVRFH